MENLRYAIGGVSFIFAMSCAGAAAVMWYYNSSVTLSLRVSDNFATVKTML
jgi:hypothetical protein